MYAYVVRSLNRSLGSCFPVWHCFGVPLKPKVFMGLNLPQYHVCGKELKNSFWYIIASSKQILEATIYSFSKLLLQKHRLK